MIDIIKNIYKGYSNNVKSKNKNYSKNLKRNKALLTLILLKHKTNRTEKMSHIIADTKKKPATQTYSIIKKI